MGGALGIEIVEVFYVSRAGEDFGFFMLVTTEELMGMLGMVIFVGGLLDQLLLHNAVLELRGAGHQRQKPTA